MKEQEKIVEMIYETYKSIDFLDKYRVIYPQWFLDSDTILKRMNKKENLNVMKELGYEFKIFTPGQHYRYVETFDRIELVLSCKISGGIITPYIYIYIDGENINHRYGLRNNLGFVYKHLTNDFEQIVNALCFSNLEDLKEIMASVIGIYEDFKKEFLSKMETKKLLSE